MRDLQEAMGAIVAMTAIAVFVVDFLLALGVGADAARRRREGRPLAFVGPGVWFLATWVGSFVALGLYWAFHYSSLRREGEFPASA